MITERMACTKRARLAGLAVACEPRWLTSSGKIMDGKLCFGVGGGAIGDGERVLRDPEGLY
jgi:hypothetical protein